MLFNSLPYFILLCSCLLMFTSVKGNDWKVLLLVIFSYTFYSFWDYRFTLVLLFSTVLDYFIGQQIYLSPKRIVARSWLLVSVITNLSLLLYFKTFFFLTAYEERAAIFLPIGISFYTFQTLSYSIDIYRKRILPEKNILHFALYVSFFPQVLAGPIERAGSLLPQFRILDGVTQNDLFIGAKQIFFGLFKKVMVADKLAMIVDPIYHQPGEASGALLLLGSLLFYFQIYCDFSGYTDIALGSARLFGVQLNNNFQRPYLARNLRDFWHRWHITLSQWFRDYVFIPLGGSRGRIERWIINIFIVFILSGLWHGIGLTFLIWGVLHALFYLVDSFFDKKFSYNRLGKIFHFLFTFFIVSMLWIPFRSRSLSDLVIIFNKIIYNPNDYSFFFNQIVEITGLNIFLIYLILIILIFFLIIDSLQINEKTILKDIDKIPSFFELVVINLMLLMMIFFGDWGGQRFIYFQF